VSSTTGSSKPGEHLSSSGPATSAKPFTLRDLYVRASISGNSLAVELDHYLNGHESGNKPTRQEKSHIVRPTDEPTVHEQALAAILEVVTANFHSTFEHVRVPEPTGGVQEWWARMLSGSLKDTRPGVNDSDPRGSELRAHDSGSVSASHPRSDREGS
jgi:hypothetical protein